MNEHLVVKRRLKSGGWRWVYPDSPYQPGDAPSPVASGRVSGKQQFEDALRELLLAEAKRRRIGKRYVAYHAARIISETLLPEGYRLGAIERDT